MKNNCGCCKLSAISIAIAAAAVSALGMVALGVLHMQYGIGAKWIELVATVYKGYAANWHGIGIGAGYAAAEGFVTGLVFTWVYNIVVTIVGKCCKCCKMDKNKEAQKAE